MPLVPKNIDKLETYKPGQSISEIKRQIGLSKVIKLASNENPFGSSPMALEAVRSSLKENFRYPDAAAILLRKKLADKFDLNLSNVTVGAGSEGVMSAIMRTFIRDGDEIIGAKNSFIGFRVLANASGNQINWISLKKYRHDLKEMAKYINKYTKLIYLANPDNPTGTYFTVDEFDHFMKLVPERVLVLLDEAYFEYAQHLDDYPDSMYYRYDNVITIRTFSKAHGLAGFRAGYGFAHEYLIKNLLKVKLPFEPSWPAQIAAIAALDDKAYIQKTIEICKQGKRKMETIFNEIDLEYIPSAANFLTLVFKSEKEAVTFTNSMLHKGVILRHLAGWGLPDCVRVTIGTDWENDYFINCLLEII